MIFIRRVVGDSMFPTLSDGQLVLAHMIRSFRTGQVVIAHVNGREVIKRIKKIENGKIFLEGDNKQASTDSNNYGPLTDTHVEGIVFWPRV